MSDEPDDESVTVFANRLLLSKIYSVADGEIAELHIDTDCLSAVIVLNEAGAKELRGQIDLFLKGKAPPRK